MHTHKSTERRRYCMYRYTHKHAQYDLCLLAKSLQLYPTLCNPVDCSPPGSSVHGILQARILEWVAMPSSRDLPDPRTELTSLVSPALPGTFFTSSTIWEAHTALYHPLFLIFIFFGHATWHVGPQFLDQGWNPDPLEWKQRVLKYYSTVEET